MTGAFAKPACACVLSRPTFDDLVGEVRHAVRGFAPAYSLDVIGRAPGGREPLLRVTSRGRKNGLVVVAGFHGEEPAGPTALGLHLHHLLGRALRLRVPLAIFPVANPSGYLRQARDSAEGQLTNAGFAHHFDRPCLESAALKRSLERYDPTVFLDLHEDDKSAAGYLYSFGDEALASRVVQTLRSFVPILAGPIPRSPELVVVDGQVRNHCDGSVEDWMSHRGGFASLATETPTALPLELRVAAQLRVVDECLEAVARLRSTLRSRRSRLSGSVPE
ncbi:MAG: hypothetical protein HY791_11740 [Deltaproteobacteria bacterium]|nr:hypothetical protein [Deltaproteobacteria bacterium]